MNFSFGKMDPVTGAVLPMPTGALTNGYAVPSQVYPAPQPQIFPQIPPYITGGLVAPAPTPTNVGPGGATGTCPSGYDFVPAGGGAPPCASRYCVQPAVVRAASCAPAGKALPVAYEPVTYVPPAQVTPAPPLAITEVKPGTAAAVVASELDQRAAPVRAGMGVGVLAAAGAAVTALFLLRKKRR